MKPRKLGFELLVATAVAYIVISYFFGGTRNFENLALGTETSSYNAVDSLGNAIHIQRTDNQEGQALVKTWKLHGGKPGVLTLGNSQTHSINQLKSGEVNYVELLHNMKVFSGYDILSISLPNASIQEMYLAYEDWREILPIHTVIIPVFMDDFREDGIRDVYFQELIEQKFQIPDSTVRISQKINQELSSYWLAESESAGIASTTEVLVDDSRLQDKSERFLNNLLDERSIVWANRPNVRGELFNWLYKLRNTLLNINASTTRKVIPQRWDNNMQALKQFTANCAHQRVKVIVYIPPIRWDAKLPYDEIDYRNFKSAVKQVFEESNAQGVFKNFETIVPAEFWGYKAATNLRAEREVDYMHFRYEGHQIMRDSLGLALKKVLKLDGI